VSAARHRCPTALTSPHRGPPATTNIVSAAAGGQPRKRGVTCDRLGYRVVVNHERDPHPHQPSSDEADPEKVSTPAGVTSDLEEHVADMGAEVADDDTKAAGDARA
jgi:hypothetical protein